MRRKTKNQAGRGDSRLLTGLRELPQAYLDLARQTAGTAFAAYLVPTEARSKDVATAFRIAARSGSLPGVEEAVAAYLSTGSTPQEIALAAIRSGADPPETECGELDDSFLLLADTRPFFVETRDAARRDTLQALLNLLRRQRAMEAEAATLTEQAGAARATGEQAREHSESLLRAVLESATDAVFVKDREGRYQIINSAGARMMGRPAAEIIGQTDRELSSPTDARMIQAQDQAVLERGVSITYERTGSMGRSACATRTFLTTKDPFYDRNGKIVGLVGISRDISERKEFEERLRSSQERYRHLFAVNPLPMLLFDPATYRLLDVNEAAIRHYGYSRDEFLGMTMLDIRPEEDRAAFAAEVRPDRPCPKHDTPLRSGIWRHRKKNGSLIDVEVFFTATRLADDQEARLVLVLDVTERLAAERARQEADIRFRRSFHDAGIGMALLGLDGHLLEINTAFARMMGYTEAELLGRAIDVVLHPEDLEEDYRLLHAPPAIYERDNKRFVRRDGSLLRAYVTVSLIRDPDKRPLYFIMQVQDMTGRWEAEQRLRWQAYHDVLTQLPNRFHFEEALNAALAEAAAESETETGIAVLLLDMDRFKRINDTLGHPAGDLLIQEVARRFQTVLPPGALLARMGGDEFTVMLQGANIKTAAREAARTLLDSLTAPIMIAGHEIFVSGSIGASIYPKDGQDAQTLLKHADIALYRAKERSRGSYRFYTRVMSVSAARDLRLEAALQRAVGRGEMALYYQPQMALTDRRIIGMEALVRWRHPEQGMLLPGQFIAMAEETGMILPLGQWALQEACRQAEALRRYGHPLKVAVNLSARQFAQMDIVSAVSDTLTRTGLPPRLLELEITETTLMETGASALDRLRALKSLGVRLSVDDFGTGYSSLSYLRHLPLDVLKIDRSFLENLPEDRESRAVIRALIEMSHSLGIFVVAEGVEKEEQWACLAEMGCDALQGFLFSEPIPIEQMGERLGILPPCGESPDAPPSLAPRHATLSP